MCYLDDSDILRTEIKLSNLANSVGSWVMRSLFSFIMCLAQKTSNLHLFLSGIRSMNTQLLIVFKLSCVIICQED